jgi:hypothetical protein
MDRDRNLLFGVLAVQLGKVSPAQMMEVAGAWATDPSRDLAQRLLEACSLSEKDCALIQSFADQAIAAHSGDGSAAIECFGGETQVEQSLGPSMAQTVPPAGDQSRDRTMVLSGPGGDAGASLTVRETRAATPAPASTAVEASGGCCWFTMRPSGGTWP